MVLYILVQTMDPYGPRTNANLDKIHCYIFVCDKFREKHRIIKVKFSKFVSKIEFEYLRTVAEMIWGMNMQVEEMFWGISASCRDKYDLEGQKPEF
jgi:hypothetical protein